MLVIVPAVSIALTARQEPLYRPRPTFLLSRQDLASSLTNSPRSRGSSPIPSASPTRSPSSRATPTVVQRTLKQAVVRRRPAPSSWTAPRSSPSATPTCSPSRSRTSTRAAPSAWPPPTRTSSRSTGWSWTPRVLKRAAAEVDRELARLTSTKQTSSGLYQSLQDKRQQLQTLETLQTSNVSLVRPAHGASQVQPRLKRNLIVALALGSCSDRPGLPARGAGHPRAQLRGDRRSPGDGPARAFARSARRAGARLAPGDAGRALGRGRRGLPRPALQPRVRQPAPRREVDHGHQRLQGRGQVDHRHQPARSPWRSPAGGSSWSISTCAARRWPSCCAWSPSPA